MYERGGPEIIQQHTATVKTKKKSGLGSCLKEEVIWAAGPYRYVPVVCVDTEEEGVCPVPSS